MSMKHLKILLVEDDPIVRLVHRTMLEFMGHHTDIAETGKQAIKMANNDYDAILLDIGLPDMTGIEVAAQIRHQDNHQKYHRIIALSGYSIDDLKFKCKTVGINEIITKPVAPHILEDTLKSQITGYFEH
ncbi:hypothetical protein BH10PSE19_BH10PSE19_00320 [soil metagenome]